MYHIAISGAWKKMETQFCMYNDLDMSRKMQEEIKKVSKITLRHVAWHISKEQLEAIQEKNNNLGQQIATTIKRMSDDTDLPGIINLDHALNFRDLIKDGIKQNQKKISFKEFVKIYYRGTLSQEQQDVIHILLQEMSNLNEEEKTNGQLYEEFLVALDQKWRDAGCDGKKESTQFRNKRVQKRNEGFFKATGYFIFGAFSVAGFLVKATQEETSRWMRIGSWTAAGLTGLFAVWRGQYWADKGLRHTSSNRQEHLTKMRTAADKFGEFLGQIRVAEAYLNNIVTDNSESEEDD